MANHWLDKIKKKAEQAKREKERFNSWASGYSPLIYPPLRQDDDDDEDEENEEDDY